jgi:ABC transporter
LEVKFKGKSIADVLDMTVEDAVEFFKAVPSIRDKMAMLAEVGLGYVKVGQQATTLSGGEAQRVKLAKELSRRATGQTLYILDEPTTGLHFEDVRKLLEVLHALVEHQNRRLGDRPRPRRRRARRRSRRGGDTRKRGERTAELHRALSGAVAGDEECGGDLGGAAAKLRHPCINI